MQVTGRTAQTNEIRPVPWFLGYLLPIGPLDGESFASKANHLHRSHDAAAVLTVNLVVCHGIVLCQFAEQIRQWRAFQLRPQLSIGRRSVAQTLQQSFEIKTGASAQN